MKMNFFITILILYNYFFNLTFDICGYFYKKSCDKYNHYFFKINCLNTFFNN